MWEHRASVRSQTASLVITHANLIDGLAPKPLPDATIVTRHGRIENVSTGSTKVPAGATIIDLKGGWLLPGLVDAHGHLYDLRGARTALAGGVTVVRSMGGSRFADVGIRELNHAGVKDVPDVIAAGYQIRPHLNEDFPLDFPKLNDLMSGLRGAENMRRIVRAIASRGVDLIKILATERAGLIEQDPFKRTFTDQELDAAVDEARKAHLPVAVHAHGDEGAAAAVRAGVHSIEHGTFLSDATLASMKQQGTYFVPTIMYSKGMMEKAGKDNPELLARGKRFLPRVREATAHAWKMGVKIAAGADAEYGRNNRSLAQEIAELVEAGIPPMDSIKSATSKAAECLGIEMRCGTVARGLEANFVGVDHNPLAEISTLQDLSLVVNKGTLIINRL